MMLKEKLEGPRHVMAPNDIGYPEALKEIPRPPEKLYIVGDPNALQLGLAVVGARKATPYGRSCARRFAHLAAEKGLVIISGGARGCDSEAHKAALEAGGRTVVFLGSGCDSIYPPEHFGLFQRIVNAGGAIASEWPWDRDPRPYAFRERNRLIAGLAAAVLIVEAGLPSGTFSTADEALDAGKEVLVVPGAITSASSHGSNRLLYQGATPVVDDETFEDALFRACGMLKRPGDAVKMASTGSAVIDAVLAQPMHPDKLYELAIEQFGTLDARGKLAEQLAEAEAAGLIARQPDGRWGPVASI